jgi:predicted short-subunit dehydrogenase-like oxidoreductase (DUF2520 family)
MMTITLLGGGNLANHLANVFLNTSSCELSQIYNRSIEKIRHFEKRTKITESLEELIDTDIYILCVNDLAIEEISAKITHKKGLIVHTSGALAMDVLHNNLRKGVFYPLQTFSKDKSLPFDGIPLCIEAAQSKDLETLHSLATLLSKKVYNINSLQRKKIHLAAVFVNNFVNHLYSIGKDICDANNIPFEILQPLILETAKKINTLAPFEAQTGPAKRKDYKTIEIHKSECSEEIEIIYSVLTDAIIKSKSHGN